MIELRPFLQYFLKTLPEWIPFISKWRHKSAQAYRRHARAYREQDLNSLSIFYYRRAIDEAPRDPGLHSELGKVFFEESKLDDAEKHFRAALEYEYGNLPALKGLGLSLHTRQNYREAVYVYLRYLGLKGDDLDVMNNLGVVLHSLGRYEKAIEYYDKALKLGPEDATILENRARALHELGAYDSAADDIQRALEISPEDSEAYRFSGRTLEATGKFQEALESYRRAIEYDPQNADARLDLSSLLSRMGNKDEALEAAKRAQSSYREKGDRAGEGLAYGQIGWLYYEIEDWKNSVAASRKALKFDPDALIQRFNLALALLHKGEADKARDQYERGIQRLSEPADLEAYAIYDLSDALRRRPDLPGGKETLRMLEENRLSLEKAIGAPR